MICDPATRPTTTDYFAGPETIHDKTVAQYTDEAERYGLTTDE